MPTNITIIVKKTDGKWLINGKTYDKLMPEEKSFFSKFILYMKEAKRLEKNN